MKVLITGGAGFIGSHLCDALLARGHEVVVLDNLSNGKRENLIDASKQNGFRLVEGNILDSGLCNDLTAGIEAIYHLACLGVRHSLRFPRENHEVNATGTLNMLEAARRAKIRRFFYISSSEIYGRARTFPIKETDTPYPITVYGSSKLAGENYTNSYHETFGLDTTVLRIFNNYGPRSHYEGDSGEVIPRSIVLAHYDRSPVIFGTGEVTRDFYYVKDTAQMLTDFLDVSTGSGETFNIGKGEEVSIRALVETVLRVMSKKLAIEYLESRPADVPRLWVDHSKIRSRVKLRDTVTIEEGLKETIQYFEKLAQNKPLLDDLQVVNWIDPNA